MPGARWFTRTGHLGRGAPQKHSLGRGLLSPGSVLGIVTDTGTPRRAGWRRRLPSRPPSRASILGDMIVPHDGGVEPPGLSVNR